MSYVCIILYHMCVEPDGAECWCAGAGLSSGGDASRDEPACRGRGTLKLEVVIVMVMVMVMVMEMVMVMRKGDSKT